MKKEIVNPRKMSRETYKENRKKKETHRDIENKKKERKWKRRSGSCKTRIFFFLFSTEIEKYFRMRRGKTRKVSRFEWQQTFRIMCLEKKELQIRQTERRKETGLTNYSWSEKGDLSAQGKKKF
jgi:hypothetical protein